jgi:hypothetical protein
LPTATPITTFGFVVPSGCVSTADVNVTDTDPPVEPTLKRTEATCRTPSTGGGTVPGNVSKLRVGDVVVADVVEFPLQPAERPIVTISAAARDEFT